MVVRVFRWALAAAAAWLVVWSFYNVTSRAVARHEADSGNRKVLTVMHWGDFEESNVVEQWVQTYEKLHPDIHIVRVNPGTSSYHSKLHTMFASGDPPDVFYVIPSDIPDLVDVTPKLIRPLDGLIKDALATGSRKWFDDYYPAVLNAFRYNSKTGRFGTGPLYALPKDFSTTVFYVNVDLFKKAGVPVPYKGWTWDEFEADCKKITALSGTAAVDYHTIYGGYLGIWADTLRQVLWSYGADFFGPGGDRDVTLNSPAAQEAMQMIARTRLVDHCVYNPVGVAKDGGEEFLTGDIGCFGPIGRWMSPQYKSITDFKWDIVPVPVKAHERKYEDNMIFLASWAMSAQTRHPKEAFDLLRYLSSEQATRQQAALGLAVPPLKSVANSPAFLAPPGFPKVNAQAFLDAMKTGTIQQLPRNPAWTRIVDDDLYPAISEGTETTEQAARNVKQDWLATLNSPLSRTKFPPVPWTPIRIIAIVAVLAVATGIFLKIRKQKLGPLDQAQERSGWLFILPWFTGFLLLLVGPMILSLLLSFMSWTAMVPLSGAKAVGLANFRELFTADDTFYQSIRVTIYFVIVSVPVSQAAALGVAMLMNVKVKGIEIYRTIYFVPSVIGGVALGVLWLQLLNNDYGIINRVLRPFATLLHTTPPNWFGNDAGRWGIPAFVLMGLWGVGAGMILYLAGLKGIPASLYEAAIIDGASRMRRFWNVTVPMLSPIIFFNLVMGIIGSFQYFTQVKVMTNGGPENKTMVYSVYLYRRAFEEQQMGYASAMAWVMFVVVLLITLLVFRASRKLVYYEGLKA